VPNKIYEIEPLPAKRRTKYQDPILQKSTKADFTSDKTRNPPHRPPAADVVYWTIKNREKRKCYVEKSISHFDRSPDSSGRSREIY